MHVLGLGNKQIASAMGVTPCMVGYTLRADKVQPYKAALEATRDMAVLTLGERIKQTSEQAQTFIEDLIAGREDALNPALSPHLRLRASIDMLDRAGYGAPKKIEARVAHALITAEDLAHMKQAAASAARELGYLEDSNDGD